MQVLSDCDIIFKLFVKPDKILRLFCAFNQLIMFMCFIESPSRYLIFEFLCRFLMRVCRAKNFLMLKLFSF